MTGVMIAAFVVISGGLLIGAAAATTAISHFYSTY